MEISERTASTVTGSSQKFVFSAEENQHSFKTSDKNITVVCTEGKHDRGSSKIKLVNVINFKWEQKNYPGRLIACHKDCDLIAYSIRVTKQSRSEGMVRVAHLDLPERGLIKGLSDEILDLQFAHTGTSDCLLGIIERTALHVHQVLVTAEKVTTTLKVKIVDPLEWHVPVCDRITWCPYLGNGGDEIDDFAKQLLVWTRGSTFQCYSISALTKSYLNTTDLKASDIEVGGFKASDGDAIITGSLFSDDGTTLALSSADGLIRFYQVYQHANDRSPRRLHLWKPHDGKAVTSFFFLDNYTETVNNKTIWKHAITCADYNTEIKVWCCASWTCLQKIRLTSPVDQALHFKAEIDISSTYLVLSERSTRQIYVMQIRKGKSLTSPDTETAQESKVSSSSLAKERSRSSIQPYIVSIAEYPMSNSILGFGILYATVRNCKFGDYYMMREQDEDDEDQMLPSCVLIRMFLVQPNNLQDCTLMFDAIPPSEGETVSVEADEPDQEVDVPESQRNSSTISSSSSSNETTDNNVSHPPSEEDDRSSEEIAAKVTLVKGEVNNGVAGSTHNNGSDDPEDEEDDANVSNPLALKMAEAAQKLNEAFVAIRTVSSSADGANAGGSSAPTTPGSATKVNLMTPESFSTPASGSRSAAKDSLKDVRIINLSELPYPEMETIMSQYDRQAGRGGRGTASTTAATTTTTTTTTSVRKHNSSVTSTASANGSMSSGDSSVSDEHVEAEGNTSIASVAGSERIANVTDDADDDRKYDMKQDSQLVIVKGKKKIGKVGFGLANGSANSSAEHPINKKGLGAGGGEKGGGGILSISGTSLNIEHFTKILTLDEAEPPTVREKLKSDETVNPDVLSTLFMLAKATKQQQQQQQLHLQQPTTAVADMVAAVAQKTNPSTVLPTTNALEAFVNMVKSQSEPVDDTSAKTKLRKSTNGPTNMQEENVTDAPVVPPMPSAEMLASGGSSPSREVQQIMSTKGPVNSMVEDFFIYAYGDRKDTYDDDDDDEEVEGVLDITDRNDEEEMTIANGTEDNPDEADGKKPAASVAEKSVVLSNDDKEPAALVPAQNDTSSELEEVAIETAIALSDSAAEEDAGVNPSGVNPSSAFWPSKIPTEVPTGASEVKNSIKQSSTAVNDKFDVPPPPVVNVQSKQMDELNGKLDSMMNMMLLQSQQIEQLNSQLEAMRKNKNEEQRRYNMLLNRVNQTLPKAIETHMAELFVQQTIKIEQTLIACLNNQQTRLTEALTHTLPQVILAQLSERLTVLLMRELQQKLLPPISDKLDVMLRTITMDMTEKLRVNEGATRDAIQRTIRTEPIVKAISVSVQTGMRMVLEQVYQESLRTIILPGYDRCSQELFRQLNISFSEGIKELMRKVDQHVLRIGRTQARTNEIVEIIRQLPERLAVDGERSTTAAVRTIRENIEKDIKGLQTPLLKTIRDHIRQEIEKGFETQASTLEDSVLSVVRSQAQTPAPSNIDVQEQIKQYLSSGQTNKAFHKALISNDLSLVEFLLDRADYKQVFNPCPLEQTVLLSLIQQISADMINHNELKHKYLSDAIVSLDFKDPITKEHSPKVIMELITNCQTFLTTNPSSPLCTNLKMVVIAAQYMGFQSI
ncbi:enhancer of mRNA-decapping protein 4 homolog [Anopheles nili]|uniref:enhancer of mRNA-decapping protein 4 homolog n=1 Tax=Anopheles nili TaxID=185578 RepID=UPI00237A6173|nr:enhancer of mRNA-decapping protein 4 homolog [Anopheles nili]